MSDQEPLVEPSSEDVGGAEACRRLNHEDLLLRVRCEQLNVVSRYAHQRVRNAE